MELILFTDASSVERAERTYLVPTQSLSDFLRMVNAGFNHPRYPWLVSADFEWGPADKNRDRVTVIFLPVNVEFDGNGPDPIN